MNHVSEAQWVAYLADEIPEALKIEYENHLYSCDKCLSVYMEAMEKKKQVLTLKDLILQVQSWTRLVD
ncbi:hypothetical protein KEH51_11450 [[Brevibacterium] frigoritolerans]|uniref:Zinc-finger domain-containing protein n=1 Tax=Peribacillus frigoritolerans TaxID=450367 RepID=A0A941FNK1_9BACI|nr:hypothetical protein [Peribacillus frigoritolerans]